MQAVYDHGEATFINLTASEDIDAGEVVLMGNVPVIAHRDIASGDLGAFAVRGAVYYCRGIDAMDAGTKVYWQTGEGGRVTKDVGSTSGEGHFGITVSDFTANGYGLVLHQPDGTLSS